MAFRFIHTADIHLDSPLKTLASRNENLADLLSEASRTVFSRIIDLCLEEKVNALFIAGDLYDGAQTSMKTARFLVVQLLRLESADIKTFIIRGNHDAESRITRELSFPPLVHLFDGRGGVVSCSSSSAFPVSIHGMSFNKPHASESLVPKYKEPISGAFNIGLLHTSLNGSIGHDPYAPCTEKELWDKGFDYWALGHIHQRFSVILQNKAIVMPGIPQGRDVNESGRKSVTLGTVQDDRTLKLEERFVQVAEFQRISISLDRITDWQTMLHSVEEALEKTKSQCTAEHLIARVHLTGSTELAWRLRRDTDLLLEEIRVYGEKVGRTHIDKITVFCEADHPATDETGDTTLELRNLIGDTIISSQGFHDDMNKLAYSLISQLPPDARDLFGKTEEELEAHIQDWTQEGVENVLSSLRKPGTEQRR